MTKTSRTVYLLGAGATRADFPDVPLGDELLDAVLTAEPANSDLREFLENFFDPDSVAQVADSCPRPRLDDIFTMIDAGLAGRAPTPRAVAQEHLRAGRWLLVAAIARMLDARLGKAGGRVAERFAQILRDRHETVLSTNYDITLDNALFLCDSVHYGVPVRSAVGRRGGVPAGREREVRYFKFDPLNDMLVRTGSIPLLKLHGSLNWLYCPRCDELDITPLSKGAVDVLALPEMGRCSIPTCTARYEPILVGPSLEQRYEHRVLRETWALAEKALRDATSLVVIGYSLPEADYLIRNMLARHFAKRSDAVLIVSFGMGEDREPDWGLDRRYKQLFPRCKFRWDGFECYANELLGSE